MLNKKFKVIKEEFGVFLKVGTIVEVLKVLDCKSNYFDDWDVYVKQVGNGIVKRYMNSKHLKEIE